jgi:hypothetical protein
VKMNPKFGVFDKSKPVPEIGAPQAPPSATPTSAPTGIPITPGG